MDIIENSEDLESSDLVVDPNKDEDNPWKERYTEKWGHSQKISVFVEQIDEDEDR